MAGRLENIIACFRKNQIVCFFLQRGLADCNEISKDAEAEANADAASGIDANKKGQKGKVEVDPKKKPPPVATGKSVEKSATVSD